MLLGDEHGNLVVEFYPHWPDAGCWGVVLADIASIPNASTRAFETQRWTGACARVFVALAALLAKRREGETLYLLVTV